MKKEFQKCIFILATTLLFFVSLISPISKVNASQGVKKIVIDAGHGGWNNGAMGNGLKEKDIALDLAKRIDSYLNKNYIVNTKMTRSSDVYLTLSERTSIANSWNADLFLSVHINSSESGLLNGYEDFVYNAGSTKMRASEKSIQKTIHNEIKPVLGNYSVANRGMKEANFQVLRDTNMPAILTETLFINNSNDSKLLKNDEFLNNIAKAHARGVAKALKLPKRNKVAFIKKATYITKANLNMRTKAGLRNTIVKTIKKGTKVKVNNVVKVGNVMWGHIHVKDKSGWISMDYTSFVSGDYVTTSNLNVRANAGVNNKLITMAKKRTKIKITKIIKIKNETWGYGKVNGKSGWMAMTYLK